jgi:hypothetical protein
MTEITFPDCLVLKIEEIENKNTNVLDTSLFVFYDQRERKYVLRGRRRCSPSLQSCTYSYDCRSIDDMVVFLRYIIDKNNSINEILYNFDNFSENSNEVSFDFLSECENKDYEISGYNDNKPSRNRYYTLLRMLKTVGNKY